MNISNLPQLARSSQMIKRIWGANRITRFIRPNSCKSRWEPTLVAGRMTSRPKGQLFQFHFVRVAEVSGLKANPFNASAQAVA